ncbi:protein AMN1 homolog [Lepeophtheirus salmonis]|uniref:protein AMN1 homolog n=1 Tax=Lepeophtheirus salmonis TaxID=72036 RepID=UPI001AE85016|nr:protein AMN1 homolog [Lepeophtheirus salmonis]
MVRSLLELSLKTLLLGNFLSENANSVNGLPTTLKDRLLSLLSSRRNGLADLNLLTVLTHSKTTDLDLSLVDWIDDEALILTSGSIFLRSLNLSAVSCGDIRIGVTPKGLMEILRNKRFLHYLNLRGNSRALNNEVFEIIKRECPSLKTIDMSRCSPGVNDYGLSVLRDLPLTSLSISSTEITDKALIGLSQGDCRKSLQEIRIDGCLEVSDSGVGAILASCNKLNVFLFDYSPKLTHVARRTLDNYFGCSRIKQISWTIPI